MRQQNRVIGLLNSVFYMFLYDINHYVAPSVIGVFLVISLIQFKALLQGFVFFPVMFLIFVIVIWLGDMITIAHEWYDNERQNKSKKKKW